MRLRETNVKSRQRRLMWHVDLLLSEAVFFEELFGAVEVRSRRLLRTDTILQRMASAPVGSFVTTAFQIPARSSQLGR